jgi:peptide chain release factor subunit 1
MAVLSVYIDLDPSQFATADARATQLNALLDEAGRMVDTAVDLSHDELVGLRQDIDRIREELDPETLGAGGARGLAVFASRTEDLFEVKPVGRPLEALVHLGDRPFMDPLTLTTDEERWCVALVSRRAGRIFLGSSDGFEEIDNVEDDTHGQHRQGGWSSLRYQRGIEEEKRDHLDNVAGSLLKLLRRRGFDMLLIGGPEPIDDEFEGRLHPYLAERVAGRVDIDVDTANGASVLEAAGPVFEAHAAAAEAERLDRFRAGIGRGEDGLAVAGPEAVTDALEQRRVEVLLLDATGPSDVSGPAIQSALEGAAEIFVVRSSPELQGHGGVGALLRF